MSRPRVLVPATHALQKRDGLMWLTMHEGSEADCSDHLARSQRHWPEREVRLVTLDEARAERRRKTWSVSDTDHIQNGSAVLVSESNEFAESNARHVAKMLGMDAAGLESRRGTVKSRHRRTGLFMIKLDGGGWSVTLPRTALIYPIPDNMVPFERRPRKRRA